MVYRHTFRSMVQWISMKIEQQAILYGDMFSLAFEKFHFTTSNTRPNQGPYSQLQKYLLPKTLDLLLSVLYGWHNLLYIHILFNNHRADHTLLQALIISENSGFNDAPPTSRPSTLVMLRYSLAFFPLALPP